MTTLDAPASASTAATPAVARWPLYLIEGTLLGMFMLSACALGVLLEHPQSPLRQMIDDPLPRRAIMGAAMGVTALGLIYCPWGRRSGAHMNPAVTLTFLRLGRVRARDATGYIAAQFAGAALGVLLASALLRPAVADPAVRHIVTRPGAGACRGVAG